jgi:hypothetical protein
MATYKVDIGHFDGQGGTLRAKAFISDVDNALIAGNITDVRMAGLVKAALRGEARTWMDTQVDLRTPGLDAWSTLKPRLKAEFSAPLTMTELATLERQLEHRAGERVASFYTRCQRYHLEEDADIDAATRDEDIYQQQFQRRVKFSFMKGLRSEIRSAMTGMNVQASSAADLLAAAKNAEIMTMKKGTAPGGAPAATQAADKQTADPELAALEANLSEDSRAVLAILERRFGRGGSRGNRGGGGRGGRGGRGRGGRGGRGGSYNGPPLDVLQQREKQLCNRCNKWVKHRTAECYVDLDAPRRGRGGGRGNRGQGRGGGGGGDYASYAQAAGGAGAPEQDFFVYEEGPSSKN